MNTKPHILLCDADPHLLHVVGKHLRAAGMTATLTSNGPQAHDLADRSRHDLYVVDQRICLANGDKLYESLASGTKTSGVPIALLHSASEPYVCPSALASTPGVVVGKPLSPRVLVDEIQMLVSQGVMGEAC